MYKMDNITITCESDITEKIQMILRQTDYTEKIAREKLSEFQNDPIKVIKDYMGVPDKKEYQKKSLNQEIYRQLRAKLDDSIKDYNKKQEEKLKDEIKTNSLQ
jgi:hypothetical protein